LYRESQKTVQSKKLWKRGYRPADKEEFSEVILKILSERKKKRFDDTSPMKTYTIQIGDTIKPSILGGQRNYIRYSRQQTKELTIEILNDDPVMHEICDYIVPPEL
jgi:hypothetical protein